MEKFKDKKILFVVDNMSFGGAQKLVLDQVNYLHKRGFDVSLLTLLSEKRGNFLDRVQIPKERIHCVDTKLNFISIWKLHSFLNIHSFDFIISNLFYSNTVIRLAALTLLRRPKIIIYEHNAYTNEKTKKHLLIDKLLSFITFKIIAVSNEVVNYLVQSGGIRKNKIAVVKNGIEFPSITQLAATKKREELGVANSQTMVVSVGNVDYQKGHDILLEAANLVNKHNKNYVYLICGRTKNQEIISKLEKRAKEYGLENNFKLLGDRADVLDIVAASDVFAMPSRWEGLSIALLEAMSLKKAIIVSDIPSMQNLIVNNVNGLKFDLNKVGELADKLLQLGGDSDLRIRLGEEAGKFVQSFHISENVKSLFSTIVFSFGKERDTFNLVGQKSDKWTKRTEAAVALLSYLPRSGKPLVIGDFGCGDGKVLRTLNEKAGVSFDYFGYDLIPQQDKVTKMDFSKDFPDKTFDLVFSLGLVEYLEKINFYFSNLSKHCGHVILSCIISDTGHYTKQQATNNGWVNYLSSTDLVKIITENNFEILESKILDNGVTYLAILKNKNVN